MDVQLTKVQLNLIKSIAKDYENYEIETKPGSTKGDGYLSTITIVIIKNSKLKLNVVLKWASASEKAREVIPVRKAFLTEIHIYDKVLPIFDEFQKQNYLLNPFTGYAKLYGHCEKEGNECLLLKDIREGGYKLWNRMVTMNSQHISLVISEYAKLHAVSLALKVHRPDRYKELEGKLKEIKYGSVESSKSMRNVIFEGGLNAVKDNALAYEALKGFSNSVDEFLEELDITEDQLVILHGDCWCNNMLFKYEDPQDNGKPTKVCLLDWQLSRPGSPVMDLAYFLVTCSSRDILYDIQTYLKLYHDTVSENLRNMNCEADKIFPFNLLEYHWKKYAKYGLYMALFVLKITLSENDEIIDVNDAIENRETAIDKLKSVNSKYNQRISDVICFMMENKLI